MLLREVIDHLLSMDPEIETNQININGSEVTILDIPKTITVRSDAPHILQDIDIEEHNSVKSYAYICYCGKSVDGYNTRIAAIRGHANHKEMREAHKKTTIKGSTKDERQCPNQRPHLAHKWNENLTRNYVCNGIAE